MADRERRWMQRERIFSFWHIDFMSLSEIFPASFSSLPLTFQTSPSSIIRAMGNYASYRYETHSQSSQSVGSCRPSDPERSLTFCLLEVNNLFFYACSFSEHGTMITRKWFLMGLSGPRARAWPLVKESTI